MYAPSSLNSYSAYGQSRFTHSPLPALSFPFEDYFGVCPEKPFLPSVTILVYDAKLCRLFVNCCSLLGLPSQNTAIWVASRTDPYPLTVPGARSSSSRCGPPPRDSFSPRLVGDGLLLVLCVRVCVCVCLCLCPPLVSV